MWTMVPTRFACWVSINAFYDSCSDLKGELPIFLNFSDIRVKEPTLESLTRKKKEYQPPRFMSVSEASDQLLQILAKKRAVGVPETELAYTGSSLFVGVARVGHDTQAIKACSLAEMAKTDLGAPLHSLILPARKLHPLEIEYLQQFSVVKIEKQ